MSSTPSPLAISVLQNVREVMPFLAMTFPLYQRTLLQLGSDPTLLVLAARQESQPAGLIVGQISGEDPTLAQILSLFVAAPYRNKGIATQLVQNFENESIQRGVTCVAGIYTTGKESTPALDRVLDRCGWSPAEPRMYLFHAKPEAIPALLQSRWMRRDPLPTGFSLFPWDELTEAEAETIAKAVEQGEIPAHVNPFMDRASYEPAYSLGLRYQGRVVGWSIAHRTETNTVRFTALHIRERLPSIGVGVRLAAESVYQFITQEAQPKGSSASWGSLADSPFAQFVLRRILADVPGMSYTLSVQRFHELVAPIDH